jgi:hypothetical protein
MNDTIKEIVGILEAGRPELQVAAAQILGELKPKDSAVVKTLDLAIGRSHVLGRYALEALAKLATPEAIRVVVRVLAEHDTLSDQASHLLSELGAAAHAAVADGFTTSPADKRHRFLTVLARHPSREALPVFLQALVVPELAERASQILQSCAPAMPAALQKQLAGSLARQLDSEAIAETSRVQILAVLGRVDPVGSRSTMLAFLGSAYSVEVRMAAMRALQGGKLPTAHVRQLLELLDDPQQKPLHDSVRDLLGSLQEWPEGTGGTLKRLMAARHPEQRLFALRALRCPGTSAPKGDEVVRIALKHLDHQDTRFREAAIALLASRKQAIEPVIRLLQASRDPARSRVFFDVLVRLKEHFAPRQARALAEKGVRLMLAHAPAGDLLFDVAVAVDGARLMPMLLQRAVMLRRSKRFAEALHMLARLAQSQQLGNEGRYQLALTRMLLDFSRPQAEGTQPGNATMGFFLGLLRDGFPLAERLRKESMVTPEALLRLATYFAETVGPERRFGAEMLQHLATRNRGRAGEEARLALRSAGL